jgi:tetratricopeptide (TPR) repeat protein/tRNA A-37 threonylcarbamoyl transferase component Bud32
VADYTGQLLGNYEVRERLGRGGMAEVYKAYHPNLNRYVAVKILHAHLADAPDFIGRFRREAQAVAQLHHPHIVQIFDFDARADLIYMVMEYVPGPSLKTRLDDLYRRGEHLPLPEVFAIFRALLDAVGYAHSQGMAHRDLKPANVMLEKKEEGRSVKEEGRPASSFLLPASFRPVLTDFGIAKIIGAEKFTATQAAIGTPAYMSPEQGQGHSGDERSDLYALGVMLYECLTGQVPYEGDTSVSVLLKHVTAPIPSLRAVRPDLPTALEQVVWKALAKNPAERFQTAQEFWEALAVIESNAEHATETTPRPAMRPRADAPTAPAPTARPAGHTRIQPRLARPVVLSIAALGLVAIGLAALAFLPKAAGTPPALAQGQGFLAEGSYQLAADSFSVALTQAPDNAQALLGHAQAAEGLGLIDEALADVERLIAIAPTHPAGYRERARLNLQYFEFDPAAALADLDKALELAGSDSAEAARAHFTRGWAMLNFPLINDAPDPAAALDDLQKAVTLDAQDAEAQFTLARALLAVGQPADALAPANRAVELAPDLALYLNVRAHIYFALDDVLAAYDDLTAAIERETDEQTLAVLYTERAYLSLQLDNRADALADAQTALSRNPSLTPALVLRHRLDAAQPAPVTEDVILAQTLVPDDPIWQAILALP